MQSALIAADFSGESEAARRRAASIASETGMSGTILHVLPGSLPPDLHLQAASQAQEALGRVAEEMKRAGLRFDPALASGDVAAELAKAARQHALIIAGARGEDVLLDFALGRISTRLVRQCDRPVLIVKRPVEQPYRRVVAAVDFSEPSFAAALAGTALAPNAEFSFVHAFEVEFESSLRRGGAAEDRIQDYRRKAHEEAMAAMDAFSRRFASGVPQKRIMERGYPARVILDFVERHGAELVVIGKHAAGIVERAVVGSVSLQVLEMAKCDVLVVPEPVS